MLRKIFAKRIAVLNKILLKGHCEKALRGGCTIKNWCAVNVYTFLSSVWFKISKLLYCHYRKPHKFYGKRKNCTKTLLSCEKPRQSSQTTGLDLDLSFCMSSNHAGRIISANSVFSHWNFKEIPWGDLKKLPNFHPIAVFLWLVIFPR